MPEVSLTVDEVFGVSRDVPLNYVARKEVDDKFVDCLSRGSHIVIYGGSKQGKTSLRKHCLKDDDYVNVSCQNRWNIADLHSAILKECGFVVSQSVSKTVSGIHKINASIEAKAKIPLFTEGGAKGGYEHTNEKTSTEVSAPLELDPADVNDIIRALGGIGFKKFIVLEDYHYLLEETQRDFAISLKAFHEKSKITFIVIGVWREENRLISYNGDLTNRVFSVDVDTWDRNSLNDVIAAGEHLLNVQFASNFRDDLLSRCFNSVHIVQEACHRYLRSLGIYRTQDELTVVGADTDAAAVVREVVDAQRARYSGFLQSFAEGFQQTDLEMPKWIVYALLISSEQLANGLRLREISRKIKAVHPRGDNLNNGNITQALISAASLQLKKGIRPLIIDYDTANLNLNIVDKGFLIWLASQDIAELCEDLSVPAPQAAS